jgi:hypothetical protein
MHIEATNLAHPAGHDVLNYLPNRVLSGNWVADAPTQSEPVDSGARRSLLSFGQRRRPWRLRSPAPRDLS